MKKIGVGISGDAHKLQRDFGVQCAGLVCLSEEANARLCNWTNGRMPQKWSLAGLLLVLLFFADFVLLLYCFKVDFILTNQLSSCPEEFDTPSWEHIVAL